MPFGATQDLTHGEIASAIFNARMIEAGYAVLQSEDWATRARAIDYPGERVFVGTSRWGRREIIRDDELLVDVSLMTGHASVAVAARSEVAAASAVDRLRALLPAPDPSG